MCWIIFYLAIYLIYVEPLPLDVHCMRSTLQYSLNITRNDNYWTFSHIKSGITLDIINKNLFWRNNKQLVCFVAKFNFHFSPIIKKLAYSNSKNKKGVIQDVLPCRSRVPSRSPRVLAPYTGSSCDRIWPCIVIFALLWYGSSSVPTWIQT